VCIYIGFYILSLHMLGAVPFWSLIDGFGKPDMRQSLSNLPRYLRITVLMLWPYIMVWWLISGRLYR